MENHITSHGIIPNLTNHCRILSIWWKTNPVCRLEKTQMFHMAKFIGLVDRHIQLIFF